MKINLLTKEALTYAKIKEDANKAFVDLKNLSSDEGVCYEKGTKVNIFAMLYYQELIKDGEFDFDIFHNRVPEKEYYYTPIKSIRNIELIKLLEIIDKYYPDSYIYDEWILNMNYAIFTVKDYIKWIGQKGFNTTIYEAEPYCISEFDESYIVYDSENDIKKDLLSLLRRIMKKVVVSDNMTIACYFDSKNYPSIIINDENNYTNEQLDHFKIINELIEIKNKKTIVISTRDEDDDEMIEKWLKKLLKNYVYAYFDKLGHYDIYSSDNDKLIASNDHRLEEEAQQ